MTCHSESEQKAYQRKVIKIFEAAVWGRFKLGD